MELIVHTQELAKQIIKSKSELLSLQEKILLSVYIAEMDHCTYSTTKPLTIFITEYNKQRAEYGLKLISSDRTLQRHRNKISQYLSIKSNGKSTSLAMIKIDMIKLMFSNEYKAALNNTYSRYNKVKYRNAANKNVAKIVLNKKKIEIPLKTTTKSSDKQNKTNKNVAISLRLNNSNELKKNISKFNDPRLIQATNQDRKNKLYFNQATPQEVLESMAAFDYLNWNWVYSQYCTITGKLVWQEIPKKRNYAIDCEKAHIKQANYYKTICSKVILTDDLEISHILKISSESAGCCH